ncbi:transcriptional activator DEMETER-like [Senna tora]|uniref:Transcriptional activator DEMETER-like n=1 Tax=Senna tora TaxID=362788 RepID=A0A834TL20_9FABA|nr:transcriptional activator DEMETER-like [Senna tora]
MSDLKIYLRRGKMRQSHNSWLPDTPAKTTPTRFLNSHICDAIRMEDASLADFIQDYKSARAMASSPGPVPQCDNVYLIEPSPTSFDIPAPAMSSTPLRSISHICDESLIMFYPMGGNNETGTQGASLEDPIHDPSILPCPVSAPQCDNNAKSIEPWPSFYIPIPAMSTPLKSNETRMEGASFDDSIHDQESATISISPDPVPHCDDNSKSIEPSPSFYIPMSTPLRSNETGMEGASLADPIHDLESATISIIPGPLHDPSILSDPVPQCDEISKSIEPSPSFYIPIPAMSTPLKSNETRMEGASLDDSILDQESATISILPDPVPHCDDNSKSIEPSPSFYIPMSTPLRSNEIGMEGASLADPIHDQESATISIIPGPLHDPSILPDPVPQCDEISESIEPSPSFYIPIPAMSTPLKSNETGTEGASLADSIYDQESATIGIIPYPRSLSIDLNSIPTESLLNCDIPTIANSTLLEPSSHICNESSVISVPMGRNDEIGNGGASLADPVHDQESETISIVPTPSSLQCEEDVNGKPIETISSIGIPTPASKDRKKKNNGQDYDTPRPQKRPKKKVYWPKVIGQSKRKRKAPETSTNESKTKKRRVSVVNGDGKPKRTPKSKTAKKVEVEESTTPKVPSTPEEKITSGEGKTLSHSSKTKSTKRSLKFELEENIEEFPHAPNWLEELGCKSRKLAFLVKKFQSLDLNYWNKELVLYKNQDKRLVLPKGKKKVPVVKINLDERSLKMWNFLMDDKPYEESDRSFSAWKGSVLDSVIGVFLTQNVSDHLSSSAYMSLAAKFPIKTSSSGESDKNDDEVRVNNSSKVNERVYDSLHLKRRKAEPQSKKLSQEDQEKITKEKKEAEEKEMQYWESLRKTYVQYCSRNSDHKSLVDWEAVRWADVKDVAKAIEGRGQHNIIALNIQIFLNRLVEMHGTIDLEWLRHAPPDEVKKYLLQVEGLGLKSVECIRLLALQHRAFPVDVNVGRIAVRLGWVPLEPLPESLPIHLLEQFPSTNVVQQYLWPRLCALDQPTLYELHYQLITFGKVFCTKLQPNCNMCPMRGECLHFEILPGPTDSTPSDDSTVRSEVAAITISEWDNKSTSETKNCEPIIEMPASPISECAKVEETDIEDFYKSDDSDEVMTINLSAEEPMKTAYNYFDQDDMNMSRALVALSENARSLPARKMKSVKRLRTERMVYVLPDTHPLLVGFKMREAGDPSPYLLVIWSPGELESSSDPCKNVSDDSTLSCKDAAEENNQTMPGTILIPCRTAMDGRFPLNGTYFQVNEVFADAETSKNPIDVPRNWIWNLQTQTAYFGTSTTTILRGTSLEEIHKCFWRGFVCVRGFDRKTGAPRPLAYKFHISTTTKQKMKKDEKADTKLGLER